MNDVTERSPYFIDPEQAPPTPYPPTPTPTSRSGWCTAVGRSCASARRSARLDPGISTASPAVCHTATRPSATNPS